MVLPAENVAPAVGEVRVMLGGWFGGGGAVGSALAAAIAQEKPLEFLNHQLYLRFGLLR
jgi:hypothetical protein